MHRRQITCSANTHKFLKKKTRLQHPVLSDLDILILRHLTHTVLPPTYNVNA